MISRIFALWSAVALLTTLAPNVGPEGVPEPHTAISVAGVVLDAGTRQPIAGARVRIDGTAVGGVSNAAGRFSLLVDDSWSGREVTVLASRAGYAEGRATLTLVDGANTVELALSGVPVQADSLRAFARRAARDIGGLPVPAPAAAEAIRVRGHTIAATTFEDNARESYAHIVENGFLAAGSNPLSTFSIDVDRASYSNVRRFIRDGRRPPIDAVRIEELVNYFPYGDPEPRGEAPLSVTTEVAPAPWQPLHHLVRIGLKGRSIDMREAPANNLVFLLDVSGSMQSPGKLPLLKTAFAMLVDELRPQDRVAIVVYAGAAGLVLPSTSGAEKEEILDALAALRAGGSTAGGAGIRLAYAVAAENYVEGGNNRVILATDGDFNVGASSDGEMVRLIEEKRDEGSFLTVLGFGTGNLQDAKMEQIADHGNGNFAYIDSPLEARKVLVSEMGGTLVTVAQDVKIQVEFNPARVAAYRLIGYENRLLAAEDFEDDTKDAGELGAGHSVTALYEVVPVGVESPVEIRDAGSLRYQTPPEQVGDNNEILFVKLRYQEPGGSVSRLIDRPVGDVESETSDDFRFAAAVAAWGMLLRDSEYCEGFSLDDVARLARGGVGADPEGYRAEFVRLVDQARSAELLAMQPGSKR